MNAPVLNYRGAPVGRVSEVEPNHYRFEPVVDDVAFAGILNQLFDDPRELRQAVQHCLEGSQ